MNAYEIEQIEKQMKADIRLPLAFEAWADVEHRARRERARVVGKLFAAFVTSGRRCVTNGQEQRACHDGAAREGAGSSDYSRMALRFDHQMGRGNGSDF
jgi:hypothetical protein